MNEKILIKFLNKYVDLEENIILFKEVEVKNLSILKLREIIYSIGNLLDEDETNKVYVCSIKSGLLNLNTAYIAVQLSDSKLYFAAYAHEGIIKQHTAERALNLFLEEVNKHNNKTKRILKKSALIIFLIAIGIAGIYYIPKYLSLNDAIFYTKHYNTAVKEYNQSVESYNSIVKESCLDNIDGYSPKYKKFSIQSVNSKNVWSSLLRGNSVKKIKDDTHTLEDMKSSIDDRSKLAKQLINPNEKWVMDRLKNAQTYPISKQSQNQMIQTSY